MSDPPTHLLAADEGELLNVVGDTVRVLHGHGPETERCGHAELFELAAVREAGPPPHRHDWSESYFCLAGVLQITLADREVVLTPGMFIHVAAGSMHTYSARQDQTRFLVMTESDGRALAFFRDMHATLNAAGPASGSAMERAMRVCQTHGVEVLTATQ